MRIASLQNGIPVPPVYNIAPGVTAEQAAQVLGLLSGSWREVTEAEAVALQKPTLEEARAAKIYEIMAAYASSSASIDSAYPAKEREGWAIQEKEAEAVTANPEALTPVLSIMVQRRGLGETVSQLAAKVLKNAEVWRLIYADLTGQQGGMYHAVNGLNTVEEIQAYKVSYRVPEEA